MNTKVIIETNGLGKRYGTTLTSHEVKSIFDKWPLAEETALCTKRVVSSSLTTHWRSGWPTGKGPSAPWS
jgi:hypothetical protein